MKCPLDQVDLIMSDRQGIEIDYCPQCRGVWLDRGELDKIIERSESLAPAQQPQPQPSPAPTYQTEQPYQRQSHERSYDYDHRGGQKKRKKEGFLGELFDF